MDGNQQGHYAKGKNSRKGRGGRGSGGSGPGMMYRNNNQVDKCRLCSRELRLAEACLGGCLEEEVLERLFLQCQKTGTLRVSHSDY